MKVKTGKTFYFSVEGQTEKLYLQWLQQVINQAMEQRSIPNPNVKFQVKIEKNPVSYVKNIVSVDKIVVTHVFDYESEDEEHVKQFRDTLDKMKKASTLGKKIKYQMGYSNFTFELWMILHKMECNVSLAHRNKYHQPLNQAYGTQFQRLDEYKQEDNFKRLLESLDLDNVCEAIRRAKQIMEENANRRYRLQKYKGFEYYNENPSLSLHIIIEKILKDCGLM